MSLTILTHYITQDKGDFQQLADLTIPIRDRYCARWGFKHVVHNGSFHNPNLYYAIQRLHLILDLMAKPDATEWYWVINIQAVITNHAINVLDFTDETHDFFITRDVNGLNAGSFLVKNSEKGREWLRFVAEKAAFTNHCWFEQHICQENENNPLYKDRIKVLDHPSINSYWYREYLLPDTTPGDWRPDHLLLSLPGMDLGQKLDRVKRCVDQGLIQY